jgi:hypothetical protein
MGNILCVCLAWFGIALVLLWFGFGIALVLLWFWFWLWFGLVWFGLCVCEEESLGEKPLQGNGATYLCPWVREEALIFSSQSLS